VDGCSPSEGLDLCAGPVGSDVGSAEPVGEAETVGEDEDSGASLARGWDEEMGPRVVGVVRVVAGAGAVAVGFGAGTGSGCGFAGWEGAGSGGGSVATASSGGRASAGSRRCQPPSMWLPWRIRPPWS